MKKSRIQTSMIAFLAMGACFLAAVVQGQTASPPKASHIVSAARKPTAKPKSDAAMQAERDEIWNSADMLRARAWLKDYCSRSAKVTPEMAKQYENELANMTPNQMRLWLMKFDEEEQQRQQQYAMFQQSNTDGLKRAMAAHRQTQQGYAAANQAETAAATNEEHEVTQQRESAENAAEDKELYQAGRYPYSYPNYFGPYGGVVQYHYHFY